MSKAKKIGKFLWKHKKKTAIATGTAVATGTAFAFGVSTGLSVANYNPHDRKTLEKMKKQNEKAWAKFNQKFNKEVNKVINQKLKEDQKRNK